MRELPILRKLLEQARRRVLTQLVLEKSVIALIVLLGGAVLLLLAGTQILDWYWIALLAAVSLGVGLYQLRGRIPSPYQVAQRIDRKLGLADALSTAFHFAANPDPLRESIAERQARDANEAARSVDASAAVPFHRPKYLMPAAVLLAAGLGLFAVRYLITGSLSLEPSLVRIALDSFFGGNSKVAENTAKQAGVKPEPFNPGSPETQGKGDEQKDDDASPGDQPPLDNPAADANADAQQSLDSDQQGKEGADSDQQGKEGNQNKQSDQDSKQGKDSKNGKEDSKQNAKQGQDSQNSMFSKLRDALSNMMKGNKSESQQQQQGKQDGKQKGGQQQESQDAASQGESQGQQQQQQASGSQKSGEGKQDQNGADSKSDQKAGEKASQDAKNGIGSADGDKKAREAAMLEAMGKIEELLGKRQQNITGEMLIEVQQTKQQLKTPWMQSQGEHGEAGGEIHRDEVPPMYQQFVEQYFEEIRKPQAGVSAGAGTSAGAAKPATPAKAAPTATPNKATQN